MLKFLSSKVLNNVSFSSSMEMGVKHPNSDLDVTLDSHFGHRGSKVSSGLGLHYQKNVELFIEIDQLKKSMDVFVSSLFCHYRYSKNSCMDCKSAQTKTLLFAYQLKILS